MHPVSIIPSRINHLGMTHLRTRFFNLILRHCPDLTRIMAYGCEAGELWFISMVFDWLSVLEWLASQKS